MFCSSKGAVKEGFLIQVLFICQRYTEGPGRLSQGDGLPSSGCLRPAVLLSLRPVACCWFPAVFVHGALCFLKLRHKWDLLPILVSL